MANIYKHPAPGVSGLQPGWFALPQNSMDPREITVAPGIGDLLATNGFSVPQNPVTDYAKGLVRQLGKDPSRAGGINGVSGCGGSCGCGGGGSCGGGMAGLPEAWDAATAGDFMGAAQEPVGPLPLWGWLALAVGGVMFMSKGRR
jgi:hypothetical protein